MANQTAFIVLLDTSLEPDSPLIIADDILNDLSTQGYSILYVRPWASPSPNPLGAPAPLTPQGVSLQTNTQQNIPQ